MASRIYHLTLSLFLLCSIANGQDTVFISQDTNQYNTPASYKTDTLVFKTPSWRHILIGTTVLEDSEGNMKALNYGYSLIDISSSECKDDKKKLFDTQVSTINKTDSIWTVEISIGANCCYSFLGEIDIVEDSIIDLKYYGYGGYCSCTCCFGLTYKIDYEDYKNQKKINYFMINGDKATLVKKE